MIRVKLIFLALSALAALALIGDFLSLDDILAIFDPEAAPLALDRETNELAFAPFEHEEIAPIGFGEGVFVVGQAAGGGAAAVVGHHPEGVGAARLVIVGVAVPGIESEVEDEPGTVHEPATVAVPPMIAVTVPIAMPVGRMPGEDVIIPAGEVAIPVDVGIRMIAAIVRQVMRARAGETSGIISTGHGTGMKPALAGSGPLKIGKSLRSRNHWSTARAVPA